MLNFKLVNLNFQYSLERDTILNIYYFVN